MNVDLRIISALDEQFRSELVSARDAYFTALLGFTALVFIGVILELPEAVHAVIRRVFIRFPRTHPIPEVRVEGGDFRSWLSLVGLALLIIGLAGEGFTEALVSDADGKLQTLSEILLRDGIQRASAAYAEAAGANERSRKLEGENLQLQADLLKLRKESEPRRLTGAQRERLQHRLERLPTPIAIISRMLDTESSDFADDFALALTAAHWQNLRVRTRASSEYGISVGTVNGEENATPPVRLLDQALTEIGLEHRVASFRTGDASIPGGFQPHVLYLIIEQHPPIAPPPTR
jgi:hypothetical protein